MNPGREQRASETRPAVIPDHELLHVIGSGSYGDVWLARNVMGTFRAVKIVYRSRFESARPYEREFAGIQRFEPISRSHDGFVDILHVGRNDAEGFFYYVMELADKALPFQAGNNAAQPAEYTPRTLASDLQSQGRIPATECLPIFLSLSSALGFLHKSGLLHRDIKPANIIFVGGLAKLADIGLVAEAGGASTYVGTEGFIPPEGPGTPQADIYGLGKVFYEAATGQDRLSFPSLPIDPGALEANRELLEFNVIFLKACARDPKARYQSAEELHADLALLQSGKSVRDLRALEQRVTRARRALALAAAFAVVAAALWALASRQAEVERQNFLRSEALRNRAERAERRAMEQLWNARLNEARALRRTGQAGRRFAALAALTNAATVRINSELRSEAAACLALSDARPRRALPPSSMPRGWLANLGLYFQALPNGDGGLFRTSDNEMARRLPGIGGPIHHMAACSSDNRWILAVCRDGKDILWDTSLAATNRPSPLDFAWEQAAFSPDNRTAAFGLAEKRLRIVDLEHRGVQSELRLGIEPAHLSFSSDGASIAIAGNETDRIVEVWNLARRELIHRLEMPASPASLAWDDAGRKLAAGCTDGRIFLWKLDEEKQLAALSGHKGGVVELKFEPGAETLVSFSWDGSIQAWDVNAAAPQWRMVGGPGLVFNRASKQLGFYSFESSTLEIAQLIHDDVVRVLFHDLPAGEVAPGRGAFEQSGKLLATLASDGIRVWDVEKGRLLLPPLEPGATSVFFDKEGNLFFSGHEGLFKRRRAGLESEGLAFAPRELVIEDRFRSALGRANNGATAWFDGRIYVIGPDGKKIGWDPHQTGLEALAMSPDGCFIGTGTRNRTGVKLWDAHSGKLIRDQPARYGGEVLFSPDSQLFVTGSSEEYVVRETVSGAFKWTFSRKNAAGLVGRMDFSPDQKWLAVADSRSVIALLEAATGKLIIRLEHPAPETITRLIFSPDGSRLAALCEGHVVQLWDMQRLRQELAALGLDWKS